MYYALLLLSITVVMIRNSIFNGFAVKSMKTQYDNLKFNEIMYFFCAVAYFIMAIGSSISVMTVLLGCIFGVVTVVFNMSTIKALSAGPMHITTLITTSSMIIPTIFGTLVSQERMSVLKMIFLVVLIGFIFLGTSQKKGTTINKLWIVYCFLAFLSSGMLGVLQKIHQISAFHQQRFGFLAAGFICAALCTSLISHQGEKQIKFNAKYKWVALGCGACVFVVNYLTMTLLPIIPSQVFFPVMNGGSILLTSVSSLIIFKEQITKRQLIGLCGGVLALVCICVL